MDKPKKIIAFNLDVTKINKDRLRSFTRRDGSTGRSLEIVAIETPGGQYGDWMVKESTTKDEKERDIRPDLPILGNGKNIGKGWDIMGIAEHREQRGDGGVAPNEEIDLGDGDEIPF